MSRKTIQGEHPTQRRQVLQSLLNWTSAIASATTAASVCPVLAQTPNSPPVGAIQRNSAKAASIAAPKPEKRLISIATTPMSGIPYLPLWVAQQKGFFAQMGLELDITEHQSTARAIQAVASNNADVIVCWLENTLSPAGRALALQSYVQMGRVPMMALGVPIKAFGQISALVQLRGRKLGVIALNSPTHTVALAALRRVGLRSSEVGMVSVGSPAGALAALRSGQIDALMHMDPLMQQLEQRGEIKILTDLRSPRASVQALGWELPSSCLSATSDFLQRFPGTAQASADAMLLALQWLQQASLRDILQFLPDGYGGMDAQSLVANFPSLREAFSADGRCAMQDVSGLWQAMLEVEPTLRLENINPLTSCTNAWMQRSLARLRA